MRTASHDAQFWLKTANEARVTAETMGDSDSAARVAMLAIAAEYEAVAKRAYSGKARAEESGAARKSAAPSLPPRRT